MKYTFGLIGTGNMGGAIARAVSQTLKDGILSDKSLEKAQELAQELGFTAGSNQEAALESRYLFLGVKPHLMGGMLESIKADLASRTEAPILVSMILIAYYVFFFGVLITELDGIWKYALGIIPLIFSAVMVKVCVERINEIKKGEENDLSQY